MTTYKLLGILILGSFALTSCGPKSKLRAIKTLNGAVVFTTKTDSKKSNTYEDSEKEIAIKKELSDTEKALYLEKQKSINERAEIPEEKNPTIDTIENKPPKENVSASSGNSPKDPDVIFSDEEKTPTREKTEDDKSNTVKVREENDDKNTPDTDKQPEVRENYQILARATKDISLSGSKLIIDFDLKEILNKTENTPLKIRLDQLIDSSENQMLFKQYNVPVTNDLAIDIDSTVTNLENNKNIIEVNLNLKNKAGNSLFKEGLIINLKSSFVKMGKATKSDGTPLEEDSLIKNIRDTSFLAVQKVVIYSDLASQDIYLVPSPLNGITLIAKKENKTLARLSSNVFNKDESAPVTVTISKSMSKSDNPFVGIKESIEAGNLISHILSPEKAAFDSESMILILSDQQAKEEDLIQIPFELLNALPAEDKEDIIRISPPSKLPSGTHFT